MKKAVESGSPFSQLPDDIVVQIYNKIMDLKTLCYCQLISKHLGLIVFQADTISFNVPLPVDYENMNGFDDIKILFDLFCSTNQEGSPTSDLDSDPAPVLGSDSFQSAIKFIKRFTKLKSMCIQFPSYVNILPDGVYLFKWKIELGARVDSSVIQAVNTEDVLESEEEGSDTDEDEEEKDHDSDKYEKTCSCLMDVVDRLKKLLGCTVEFPLLEEIFIMDSNERGFGTLSGGDIVELRKLLHSYGTSASDHLVYHSGEMSDTG
uniref:F-box protein At4g18380-like n=1 Tax=Erigeron canadensis TaxID=72917 RepID=UPI001CB8EF69|nr:F-box protein At4g18380-like [Erigeron canadensis]